MRKESSTLQKCKRQMATLGFDSQLAYHRVKLILKIYRDVVWVLSERVEELHEYAWELGAQDAEYHRPIPAFREHLLRPLWRPAGAHYQRDNHPPRGWDAGP